MRLQGVYDSDPDWRRDPKTTFFCFRCQKDLKPGQPHRWIQVLDMMDILRPGDENITGKASAWYPVGMDCAKRIGLEWTHATPNTARGE